MRMIRRGDVSQPQQREMIADGDDKTSRGECFPNNRCIAFFLCLAAWRLAIRRLMLVLILTTALDDVFYCGVAASPSVYRLSLTVHQQWRMTATCMLPRLGACMPSFRCSDWAFEVAGLTATDRVFTVKNFQQRKNKWHHAQQMSPRIPLQGAATWRS